MTDGPRLIGRKEAAAYCGIAESTFSMWVATNKMPAPIHGTRKWDRRAIDAKLDEISGLLPVKAAATAPPRDGYERWKKKNDERKKHAPIYKLQAPQMRALRFLTEHPDCRTVDLIPRTGEKTMEALEAAGCVQAGGKDHHGSREWYVTDEGREEVQRAETFANWVFD